MNFFMSSILSGPNLLVGNFSHSKEISDKNHLQKLYYLIFGLTLKILVDVDG